MDLFHRWHTQRLSVFTGITSSHQYFVYLHWTDVTKSPYDSGKAAARYTIPMANAYGLTSIASSAMMYALLLEPELFSSYLRAQGVNMSGSVQI